ncbi:hypothetical protein CBOM_07772 [Ceraceosorus bombacis]|uniref:Uncharacterized protein n=1 Tax=Ceraceosorus bombacis TaxID=401625 RepID=A0A0P1BN30_9BASI|nr:hypothetical protein CBOM_07772 [Ceraceosorus bombacis]
MYDDSSFNTFCDDGEREQGGASGDQILQGVQDFGGEVGVSLRSGDPWNFCSVHPLSIRSGQLDRHRICHDGGDPVDDVPYAASDRTVLALVSGAVCHWE